MRVMSGGVPVLAVDVYIYILVCMCVRGVGVGVENQNLAFLQDLRDLYVNLPYSQEQLLRNSQRSLPRNQIVAHL